MARSPNARAWRRGRLPGRLGGLLGLILALAGLAAPSGPALATDLQEQILEEKYKWGDYGLMAGWYKPNGSQFTDHGDYALPIGLQVRFKWLEWFRVEGELTYYRKSSVPASALTQVGFSPAIEGLYLATAFQTALIRSGPIQPYVGAGVVLASIRNDFVTKIRVPDDVPDSTLATVAFASWGKWDVGYLLEAGVDFPLGYRLFPFAEFRYLFGEMTLEDIRIGNFPFDPEELENLDGSPVPGTFDWGGPQVMVGLKILF